MSNLLSSPSAVVAADLDPLSWQAICGWPARSHFNVVKNGLDYGALTRYFLWDKVPRAIRYQVSPDTFSLEAELLARRSAQKELPAEKGTPSSFWEQQVEQPFNCFIRRVGLRLDHMGRSVVFIPRQHAQLRSTIEVLRTDSSFRLIAPDDLCNAGIRTFQILPKQPPDTAFAERLCDAMIEGLRTFGIDLLPVDQQTLRRQLLHQASVVRQAEAELAAMRPHIVLVFTDNHTPSQEYVAIANQRGIPTVMVQHGLDCEQYCLNDAYAHTVAVWGNARKQRYEKESQQQPTLIQITGNPRYDPLSLPQQLCPGGNQWLWVTRPHGPEKCCLPSRSPREGLDILTAILGALKQNESAQLTIKPHPFDYADLYALEIEKQQLSDRVHITHDPLDTLLTQFDAVISEDSTAAMEAMFFGKIVIHSHFAASAPVLPLVAYGAALSGHHPDALQASLSQVSALTAQQRSDMLQAQRNFIDDYAGPLDGQASGRVTALINRVIAGKHC